MQAIKQHQKRFYLCSCSLRPQVFMYPELYQTLREGRLMSHKVFFEWVGKSRGATPWERSGGCGSALISYPGSFWL